MGCFIALSVSDGRIMMNYGFGEAVWTKRAGGLVSALVKKKVKKVKLSP
jgi:hypothetical protein